MLCPKCGSVSVKKHGDEYECLVRNCNCFFIIKNNLFYIRAGAVPAKILNLVNVINKMENG